MKFILDTNIFITAKNVSYPFDLFPSFWEQLLIHAKNKDFYISEEILEELIEGSDELSEWIIKNKDSFEILKSDDENVIQEYSKIITAIQSSETYKESAKEEFARVADSWIIAQAKAHNLCLVTKETKADPYSRNRVKIPNVCEQFSIQCIDLLGFMRFLEFRF